MTAPTERQLGDAHALLSSAPIFDGHNDLPWALHQLEERGQADVDPRSSLVGYTHTDTVRLVEGGVGAQFWSVYVPSRLPEDEALGLTVRQVVRVHRMVQSNPDRLALATTADECVAAREAGLIASLLVAEMNLIGMIVDLSHTAVSTMDAALDVTTRPVLFSHSSARALVDHPRNVPDDVLRKMAAGGGVCQVTFVPSFVSSKYKAWVDEATAAMAKSTDAGADADYEARDRFFEAYDHYHPRPTVTIADVADHVDHVREVAGVDHVGLGGDYDGVDVMPEGLEDVSCYPRLIAELLQRGWSGPDLAKLTWSNVLRVVRDCCG